MSTSCCSNDNVSEPGSEAFAARKVRQRPGNARRSNVKGKNPIAVEMK
jgi:hypothetical protein